MSWSERFEHISVQLEERIATITIARAAVRNALHPPASAEIATVLDRFDAEPQAAVAIITGEGEQAFCAGFDLRYADQHPQVYQEPLLFSDIVRRPKLGKPVIAAVNGLALGLGFELALACDLIIAAPHARFGLPEPRVGLAAMGGGVVRLTQQIGLKRALGIILPAKMVTAEEGLRAGFVNEISAGPVLECARRWALTIAECGPLSLLASKEMAYRSSELPDLAAALDPRSYPAVMRLLRSEDVNEGRRAFLEHRKPDWKGR
ncbi:MAG TPA: enoyl-CoA hydratase-related protein [Steroidobacteraceae bacterium]|nr:enoyl-CoA hydratase-related protein [Steroidobacteraceae bacterium]